MHCELDCDTQHDVMLSVTFCIVVPSVVVMSVVIPSVVILSVVIPSVVILSVMALTFPVDIVLKLLFRRYDIQHNETQHNDTHQKGLIWDTRHKRH